MWDPLEVLDKGFLDIFRHLLTNKVGLQMSFCETFLETDFDILQVGLPASKIPK